MEGTAGKQELERSERKCRESNSRLSPLNIVRASCQLSRRNLSFSLKSSPSVTRRNRYYLEKRMWLGFIPELWVTGSWGPSGSTRAPAPRLLPRCSTGGRKPQPGRRPERGGSCGDPATTRGAPAEPGAAAGSGPGWGRRRASPGTTATCGGGRRRAESRAEVHLKRFKSRFSLTLAC